LNPRRLVVDASAGVKWVFPEDGSAAARVLLERAATGSVHLIAPDLYAAEALNVAWKRCRLRGEITEDEAREASRRLLALLPDLVPSETLASQALALALTLRRTVYDCLYLALALRDGSILVTGDRRFAESVNPITGRVVHVADVPALL
jgi:predicted nucleic acid-binding protein